MSKNKTSKESTVLRAINFARALVGISNPKTETTKMETDYDKIQRKTSSEHRSPSGIKLLAQYLEKNGAITPMQALSELGIYRLGARVFELRHDYDWQITCEKFAVKGKIHSKYILIKKGKEV